MLSKPWTSLIVAICTMTGIACKHSSCQQCASGSTTSAAQRSIDKAAPAISESTSDKKPILILPPPLINDPETFVSIPDKTALKVEIPSSSTAFKVQTTPQVLTLHKPQVEPIPLHKSIIEGKSEPPQPPLLKTEQHEEPSQSHGPASVPSQYAHALNFSTVTGQLQYLHSKQQWRVRYASCDVEDVYGGVVTLRGVEHLADQLKDGSTVHIQGQLVHPDGKRPSPEYQVYDLKNVN